MTPSPREASTALNSQVWSAPNNNYDPQKFLRGSPTKTSLPFSNAAVINLPVDDGIRYQLPINPTRDPATSQEWHDLKAGFDDFLVGFVKFRNKYGPTDIQADEANTCTGRVDGDADSN